MSPFKNLLILVLSTLTLAACAPLATPVATAAPAQAATSTQAATAAPSTGFTITDALGRTVTFKKAPMRITLAGRSLIMVADAAYLFPEASSRITATSTTKQGNGDFLPVIEPNLAAKALLQQESGPEQVAATQPDVVLMKSIMASTLGKPLEALGIPVVYVDFETPEQYERDLTILGKLFQNDARAKQLVTYFQGRVDKVLGPLAGLKEDQKPSVLILYYNDRDAAVAFNVPPLSYIQTTMVKDAGGRPAWTSAQLGSGWTKVNFEQIAAWDADQVYIVSYTLTSDQVIAKLKADPQWQALRAVKQNQLYAFPIDYYSWDQSDVRWILGLTWLATKIQPQKFANVDMMAETRSFYKDLYNMDEASFQKNIQPLIKGSLK
jgi:iron complex transport system substrate-binding protein